jgi:prepilin-type N-terminal cleavage/methylation domain-containing protein
MLKQQKTNSKGFTIIEVMIVLAIAGLILLIVFLAVPALQRNSRNTQRKTDIADTLAGISDYVSNHNGSLPPDNTTFQAQLFTNNQVKLGFYTGSNVTYSYSATAITLPAPTADVNKAFVYNYVKCDPSTGNPTVTGATSRNVAAIYFVETGGSGTTTICAET